MKNVIPRIHNLPEVIFINWFGFEIFIKKFWII
jgi:hypothetical protein